MNKRSVLFYRHFDQYSGGHQKVFDYFTHLYDADDYRPAISFSSTSEWNESNPWFPNHESIEFLTNRYDYLFLAGMDWSVYAEQGIDLEKPVINLIQHVRHASSDADVYPFLKNKAIRICVSPEVASAVRNLANGPVITIANGIEIPEIKSNKTNDVYIAGYKNKPFAKALANHLAIEGQTEHLPRKKFLYQLAAARIAVLLPHPSEGFFLPALEAMRLAEITIVPDCIGNRSFCIDFAYDQGNCLMPSYDLDGLIGAVHQAKEILRDKDRLNKLKTNSIATVNKHSLMRERQQFLALMCKVDELWRDG
jgi:hypothetical protein